MDTSTQGNWVGVYGADGYALANGPASPAYGQLSYGTYAVQNQQNWIWSAGTIEDRALQDDSGRIEAAWYSPTSFSFDVNLTDSNSHQVALYMMDWEGAGRSETIQILDATSGLTLDTQTIPGYPHPTSTDFVNGAYLVWSISGHVTIKVIAAAGPNAVVSGIFFGSSISASPVIASATFTGADTSTQGNWTKLYGDDGYALANGLAIPASGQLSYGTYGVENQNSWTWAANTTDGRALQDGTGRIAATWFSPTAFSFDVNLTDTNPHQVALYVMDWEGSGRDETVQIVNASTNAALDRQNISAFTNGVYLIWSVSGHVRINVILTGGINAVVSGIFFGTAGSTQVGGPSSPAVSLTWSASLSPAASGYNVYRSNASGSGYTKINSTPVSALNYTDTTVASGQTYYYVTTAVDSTGDESVFSNEVQENAP